MHFGGLGFSVASVEDFGFMGFRVCSGLSALGSRGVGLRAIGF